MSFITTIEFAEYIYTDGHEYKSHKPGSIANPVYEKIKAMFTGSSQCISKIIQVIHPLFIKITGVIIAIGLIVLCALYIESKHNELLCMNAIRSTIDRVGIIPEHTVIISVSTSPLRLAKLIVTAQYHIDTGMMPSSVSLHIQIPWIFERTGEKYPVIISPHAQILLHYGVVDDGPATKLLGAIEYLQRTNKSRIVITVDDDIIYFRGLVEAHWLSFKSNGDSVSAVQRTRKNWGESKCIRKLRESARRNVAKTSDTVDGSFVEGFASVAYPSHLIDVKDIRRLFSYKEGACRKSDDWAISTSLIRNNIGIVWLNIYDYDCASNMIKQLDYGFGKDALHKQQVHIDAYDQCCLSEQFALKE